MYKTVLRVLISSCVYYATFRLQSRRTAHVNDYKRLSYVSYQFGITCIQYDDNAQRNN